MCVWLIQYLIRVHRWVVAVRCIAAAVFQRLVRVVLVLAWLYRWLLVPVVVVALVVVVVALLFMLLLVCVVAAVLVIWRWCQRAFRHSVVGRSRFRPR